jgi:hypothetical protein
VNKLNGKTLNRALSKRDVVSYSEEKNATHIHPSIHFHMPFPLFPMHALLSYIKRKRKLPPQMYKAKAIHSNTTSERKRNEEKRKVQNKRKTLPDQSRPPWQRKEKKQ